MKYEAIKYYKKANIGYIKLSSASAGNKIDGRMSLEIEDACQYINQTDEISLVVICGEGDIFSYGCDPDNCEAGTEACNALASLEAVTLAAVNGAAFAEGLELALACDIRIASERARFSLPQIAEGRIPSSGGTQRLPRLVGKAKALEMILTGSAIDAREAYDVGLLSRVVTHDALCKEIDEESRLISGMAPIALKFIKEAVNAGMDMTLEQGLRLEADLYFLLHTTADRIEGIRAFLKKEPPKFRGK